MPGLVRGSEANLYSKHIAWIGSLSFLYLAACSGSDESSTPPGFVSGPAGAPSVGAPSVGGTGGQPAVSGSAGGSSGEMGAVNGGLSGVGGTATQGGAPVVDAGSGADAGGAPADPGGLVGTGPSGLPAPPGPDTVARPAG